MADYSDFTISLQSSTVAAAAANADAAGAYVIAPFAGRVTAASFLAAAATTGANTDSRTYQLHNRGTGSGTTLVASRALLLATDNVADAKNTMTLTATVADRVVAEGDVLELTSLHVGSTGLAGQSGVAIVTFQRVLA